jgi:transcriptional regulator of acetoin/glycerol metabolism
MPASDVSLAAIAAEAERDALRKVLLAANGNISATARALGVHRATVHRRIHELGLAEWVAQEFSRSVRQPSRRPRG